MSQVVSRTAVFFHYLGKLVTKRSKAFTCCAGCDELCVPIGRRFCVSLSMDRPVDIVLTRAEGVSVSPEAPTSLRASMPWIGRLFVLSAMGDTTRGAVIGVLPADVDESKLHEVEDLAEYFVVLPWEPGSLLPKSLLREDFFTVNGLPLLFAGPGGSAETPRFLPGPASRTKRLSALFADACAVDPILRATRDEAGYTIAFSRWAYAERHGVLAPSPFDD
jgi:hypothetical protein